MLYYTIPMIIIIFLRLIHILILIRILILILYSSLGHGQGHVAAVLGGDAQLLLGGHQRDFTVNVQTKNL